MCERVFGRYAAQGHAVLSLDASSALTETGM